MKKNIKKVITLCVFFLFVLPQSLFSKLKTKSRDCYCHARRNSPCSCPDSFCYLGRCGACHNGKTFFQPRSQNTNTARRSVGHHNFRHQSDETNKKFLSSTFSITPEYSQSFKPLHIAEYFFGTHMLGFTGSMVTNRYYNDVLADYFGLSPKFEGIIRFEPQIKSFLLDFDLLLEFNKGVYLQIYTPLVRTKWQMLMCESVEEAGLETNFPAGYMDQQEVEPPVSCIKKALGGHVTFGDVSEGIKYGKFCCEQKTTKLADVTFLLGWIFLNRERGYVGVNWQFTVPTGTRPNNTYIFEPVAGNGHHWEFGIGFTGRRLIWEKDADQTLHIHFDANFSHLFKTCQRRSFDLKCNGFLSRYMLLKEFSRTGNYTGKLTPAINITTLQCKVKVNFQMDLNIMFAYNNKNWNFDFGYNGWLRSHEKICVTEKFAEQKYGLKGIQNVFGVLDENATQSCATIYGNNLADQANVEDDIFPSFVRNCDIDVCSAESPKLLTHKFYSHVSHAWEKEERCTTPYLGVGWQIEFESIKPRDRCPYKNSLYQWALWLKLGVAYN